MGKPAEPRTPLLHPSRRAALRRRLSAWYALARRDLPWRATRDPYAVWVSEVMLQQTTVAAATPYWSRFLERFPDVASLAAAPEEDVLRAWSGLGYYRRAKNMHVAAREIVERHGGRMPRGSRALRELPGIGAYTSAAIASICHGEPAAVVDGNVLRVLARLELVEGNVARRRARGLIERLADELLDPAQPGDHNQAVMELGATVCRPREPDCPVCPWRSLCRARREGAVETVPRMPERAAPIRVLDAIAIVRGPRGTVLLKRVPEGRRNGLPKLYGLPCQKS